MLRSMLKKILSRFDLVLTRETVIPSPRNLLRVMSNHGYEPETVFDIGVAHGTPWLYEAFPKAKFHLIDPTKSSLPYMQEWSKKLNAEVHNFALGSETGNLEIKNRTTIEHATLLRDVTAPDIIEAYNVPVKRFDDVFDDFANPAFVKIDVEGAEHQVITGMTNSLKNIELVVVEVSLNSLYEGGVDFFDVAETLRRRGFCLFDICETKRRPFDSALHQVDAVFVQQGSAMRIKKWN